MPLSVLHPQPRSHEPGQHAPVVQYAPVVESVEMGFDAAALGQDRIAAAAGEIYRARRAGKRVTALAPDGEGAEALAKACDRIGLRAGEDLRFRLGTRAGGKTLPPVRPLRIAIAGFGVVGQAVAERLRAEPAFEILSILVRDVARPRKTLAPAALTSDPEALLACGADILIEAMSCERAGAALCEKALARGVHVVTASKRVVSGGKPALEAAARNGAVLAYSAAVGGGAPVIETIERLRGQSAIASVSAILNGTTNFILDRLASGNALEEALAEARAAGFAEENSDYDLSGADAAAKLRILAHHAFGTDPAELEVTTQALDADRALEIAASGERWVQLGRLTRDGASVSLVPAAQVPGLPQPREEWNAALIQLEDGRAVTCSGRGAGGAPTAEAIVADLHDLLADGRTAADEPRALRQAVAA